MLKSFTRRNFQIVSSFCFRSFSNLNKKSPVIVVGHQNPDTDAITAAVIYTDFLRRTNVNAESYRLGELNNETKFVLRKANIQLPPLLDRDLPEGTEVALVDHNESQQSIKNIHKLRITRVIDHHKIGDLTTSEPIFVRFEPVGCTSTILCKLYRENQVEISQQMALLMCSAILSDTLHFRSPTTTEDDRRAVEFLQPIAKISDLSSFAQEIFDAKSDLTGFTIRQILLMDYKVYTFKNEKWGIGTGETCSVSKMLERKEEFLKEMNEEKRRSNLRGILFSIVDILNEKNLTLVPSDIEATIVRQAFTTNVENYLADLGPRISRKKQIIPSIEKLFR